MWERGEKQGNQEVNDSFQRFSRARHTRSRVENPHEGDHGKGKSIKMAQGEHMGYKVNKESNERQHVRGVGGMRRNKDYRKGPPRLRKWTRPPRLLSTRLR